MTTEAFAALAFAALIAIFAYAVSFRRSFIRIPETADAGPLPRVQLRFFPLTILPIENKCLRWTSNSSSKSHCLRDFNQYAPYLSEVPGPEKLVWTSQALEQGFGSFIQCVATPDHCALRQHFRCVRPQSRGPCKLSKCPRNPRTILLGDLRLPSSGATLEQMPRSMRRGRRRLDRSPYRTYSSSSAGISRPQ
jgi:hypothetical protein